MSGAPVTHRSSTSGGQLMPFLTDIDPRAKIRGSRDALGLVPLWGHFGRHVVGNLTTVSTSVRGFTTLLLGYYFARKVEERDGLGLEATLPLFIKFEQLAAYSRWYVCKDGDFRGIDRVKSRLAARSAVTLSAEPSHQILASQKVYGLWGLYSVPARASGLVELQETTLTSAAREFVEAQYLPRLSHGAGKDGRAIVEILRGTSSSLALDGKHAEVAGALGKLLASRCNSVEREFYWRYLVAGGPGERTAGLQQRLAELMVPLVPLGPWFDRSQLSELIKVSKRKGDSLAALVHRLERIDRLETVLVPTSSAFGFLLSRHGQTTASVASEIAKTWGQCFANLDLPAFRGLQVEISESFGDPAAGQRWIELSEALAAADYEQLIRLLAEQNAFVMKARNSGDAWVRIVDGRLDIRFRDESSGLLPRKEFANSWWYNYFLDPLKFVVAALAEA